MSAASHTTALADRLPVALSEGPAVRSLLGALGVELDGAEQGIFRLFRSRHLRLADHWWGAAPPDDTDLGLLCALVGLRPLPGERSGAFRDRVRGLLAVHRAGLGTAEAILRLAALALRLEGPVHTVTTLRGGQHSMIATGQARVDGRLRAVSLELLDNPDTERSLRHERWTPGTALTLTSDSVTPTAVELRLRSDTPMVAPMLRCGRRAVVYAGQVPAHTLFQLRPDGARLNGRAAPAPLLGILTDVLGEQTTAARFATSVPLPEVLWLPPGESAWTLSLVSPGVARALAHEAGLPCDLVGEDEPCDATPDAEWLWRDATAACFTVRVPDLVPDWARDRAEVAAALRDALDYGRAAGVEARLELHVQLQDEGVTPQDSLPAFSLGLRSDLGVSDAFVLTAQHQLLERYGIRERRFLQVEATRFQVFEDEHGTQREGFKLDEALFGRAPVAQFEVSAEAPDGAVALDRHAFALAAPAVVGASRFDKVALAWAGEAADPEIRLDPADPRIVHSQMKLGDEGRRADAPSDEGLDHAALSAPRMARFERDAEGKELGLRLDHVALAFGLTASALGRLRLGRSGFTPSSTWVPPEGWPETPKVSAVHIQIDEALSGAANTENIETGDDNG